MRQISADLQQVRSRICDMMTAVSAIFVVPALAASLYRITNVGWQANMGVHIVATVAILLLYFYRHSLPYGLRAGAIVFIFLIVGTLGFWKHGLIAGANPMLIVAPILATILFGKRLGIVLTTAVLAIMVFTAYTFTFGGRPFHIETGIDAVYLPAWITYLMTIVMTVATTVAAIAMSNRHLASALVQSRKSQDELTELNRNLERQVYERTQELEEAKLGAEQQARTDVLTGQNNRRAFFEYAEIIDGQSRRYNHSYVFVMIDIDHFKVVNDTWGHDAGDMTLIAVGDCIKNTLRETDITGRIGGEEFAVIMPETAATEGLALAERLRKAIEDLTLRTEKAEIKVTASVGIAACDDPCLSLERVVTHADAALYRAKNAGRNRVESHLG